MKSFCVLLHFPLGTAVAAALVVSICLSLDAAAVSAVVPATVLLGVEVYPVLEVVDLMDAGASGSVAPVPGSGAGAEPDMVPGTPCTLVPCPRPRPSFLVQQPELLGVNNSAVDPYSSNLGRGKCYVDACRLKNKGSTKLRNFYDALIQRDNEKKNLSKPRAKRALIGIRMTSVGGSEGSKGFR